MAGKRQLVLPGLMPAGDGRKRAKRDYKADEFARALARNGFAPVACGTCFVDTTGQLGGVFHAVCRHNPIRIARRATLAKMIRARAAKQEGE